MTKRQASQQDGKPLRPRSVAIMHAIPVAGCDNPHVVLTTLAILTDGGRPSRQDIATMVATTSGDGSSRFSHSVVYADETEEERNRRLARCAIFGEDPRQRRGTIVSDGWQPSPPPAQGGQSRRGSD